MSLFQDFISYMKVTGHLHHYNVLGNLYISCNYALLCCSVETLPIG
jgi:hypothetical protein